MVFRLTILLILISHSLFSQDDNKSEWLNKLKEWNFKPSVYLQFWATHTQGMEIYRPNEFAYEHVDDRLNFSLHRSRYSVDLQPYERLKFNVTVAMDFIGRDALSALDAGQNNGPNPILRLWQTYLQLKLSKKESSPYLTFGYFPTRVGRESTTSPWRVTSMEKAWSQNYIRRHLTGIGPGRTTGINLGGQTMLRENKLWLKYDFGLHTPVYQAIDGNSTGKNSSPLGVSKFVLMIGQPESDKYSLGNKVNYFGKRNGLSIAFTGAAQGATDLFEHSHTLGGDMLLNINNFNFDGEWYFFNRKNSIGDVAKSQTGHLRASYNLPLKNGYVFEPVAMIVQYNGEMSESGQEAAQSVGMPAGKDRHIDIGCNLYFNPDLKLSLHYILRSGDAGDAGDGSTINNYFVSGAGAVRYGDWLGLGLAAIF